MRIIDITGPVVRKSGKYEEYLYDNDYTVKLFRKDVNERYVRLYIERHIIVSNISMPTIENMELVRDSKHNRVGVLAPYVEGQTLQEVCLKAPSAVFKLMATFAAQHRFIHSVASSGLLPQQKDKFREKILNNRLLISQQKKRLLNLLHQLPDDGILCHGAYSPAKLFLSKEGIKLLDWRSATSGSPVADVASTFISLKYAWGTHGRWALLRRLFCKVHSWLYLSHYRRNSNLDFSCFKQWLLISAVSKMADTPDNIGYVNYVKKRLG